MERVIIVTGANTGIGRATAVALAKRGDRLFLANRSAVKGEETANAIRAETNNDRVEHITLDLGSLGSVRDAARAFLAKDLPLHVLINNAGVAGQRGETKEGFELQFGTNHLGHFLFTKLLLERLKSSAPARIVNVASQSHYEARGIDWELVRGKTRTVAGLKEYEVSKLANVLFTKELARRLAGTGVTAYALHPGVVASDAWRRIPWPIRKIVTWRMLTNDDGAKTTLYCANAPELANESGYYYDDCKRKEPNKVAYDEALARELWEKSEAWTA